ncbi:DUF747-domain-containing protein [Metschnikowia bicuspidata var. bicuspidata NRRL YB-4993]|uniref:DUF747-domain-containing protein n=1 Tax=Metschnikowia bicuspidata var. bicuspidata NRRL YB-4993 TaxID=869754 RepID=A0A1A0HC97_9ASCO|nr:DUF747-domain-containing protein [Metschnikowia bicuspidata var. bicuspidata NRRL YB-4993]OBA21754.1 DUF747-domain-containing protein [Metschnikowia bicuspidata var. bicuspidata NRRL YB-4993]
MAKIRRRENPSATLGALQPTPSTSVSSAGTNSGRPRSSTTALLNYINDVPKEEAQRKKSRQKLVSLYRLLVLELNLPGSVSTKSSSAENKGESKNSQEQLANMVKVPFYLEKFICFGLLVCSNAFLTLFTLVPLKIAIVTFTAFKEFLYSPQRDMTILIRKLHFVKRDLITLLLIISSVALLSTRLLEVSRLYHDIRGQAHIKLYVMFGVLEVTDKLLSSIALEIFTVLVGLPLTNMTPNRFGKLVFFSVIALVFFACHSYVLIYQSVALHVAANSYSNALLALLLSNQFSELKGAVFKKFEREGLFQITMSDLTERFQLSIMLFVIALRNLSQLSSTQLSLVPDSWKSWNKWFGAIFGPSVVVLGSEILVDWIKHCYISKFNLIRPRTYENFLYVLSTDFKEVFTSNSKTCTLHEVSDYIILTRRIGLPIIPLTICFLRMALKDLRQFFLPSCLQILSIVSSVVLIVLAFVVLLVARLLLGLWLLKWARFIKHNHEAFQQNLQLKADISSSSQSSGDSKEDRTLRRHQNSVETEYEQSHPSETEDAPCPPVSQLLLNCPPLLKNSSIHLSLQDTAGGNYCDDSQLTSPLELEIEYSFIPGIPNTESSSINPTMRSSLYDFGEKVPPTLEEKRNKQLLERNLRSMGGTEDIRLDSLHKVHRYEMSSKKIW